MCTHPNQAINRQASHPRSELGYQVHMGVQFQHWSHRYELPSVGSRIARHATRCLGVIMSKLCVRLAPLNSTMVDSISPLPKFSASGRCFASRDLASIAVSPALRFFEALSNVRADFRSADARTLIRLTLAPRCGVHPQTFELESFF